MNIIQICLLFAGISFCLAFVALGRILFRQVSLHFFLCYLCLEALNFSLEWLVAHPGSPYKALWLALMMASSFLMAPCIWLFAREIHLNGLPNLRPIAWGQVALVILGFILCIPLLMAANEGHLLVDPSRPRTPFSNLIHSTMIAAVLLYLVQVPWYLARSMALFKERLRASKFLFSSIDEPALVALRALIWVMAANWITGLFRMLQVMIFDHSPLWDLLVNAVEVGVTLAALYVILVRCWQYSFEDQRLLQELSRMKVDAGIEKESPKYAKSTLTDSVRARVLSKVLEQFEVKKIYRKSGLKLQDLCEAINENAHYVSQVINQDLTTNFYDLANQYRIDEAKVILKADPKQPVLQLALEVGFNSKSTFNKVFKEKVGTTPSDYRCSS